MTATIAAATEPIREVSALAGAAMPALTGIVELALRARIP